MPEKGQEPTPEAQAVDGEQTEPEQKYTTQDVTTDSGGMTLDAALARIKELNAEAARYRHERKAADKARADAEAAALAEQGKYKELYESVSAKAAEYDNLRERYDALVAQVKAGNDKRIAAIPEGMRTLVPDYDDPQRLADWLDANSAVFQKPVAPSMNGGAGGEAVIPLSDEEIREQAVRLGVSPALYKKSLAGAR